jgi:putative two-component system response regulator
MYEMPLDPHIAALNGAGRILIVDDEPYIREILARWLVDEGYACDQAADAESALRALAAGDLEMMISDIRMPGRSGLELLDEARSEYPELAVIMLTAVDDRETAIRTLEAGAYGYVIKPFDRNELLISVVNAFERRRLTMLSADYQHQLEEEVRQRTEQLRLREEEIALRLVTAAEHRDAETGAHIRRIGLYSEILARACGWDSSDAEEIRLAAPMHDVGKIGIPDHILLKPGSLTSQEFGVIERHTTMGAAILAGSRVPLLRLACEIALTHHERWDGSGYPRGLARDQIPEAGRIVAVADVYDALVHSRVYRPALPEEQALNIMRRARGRHFDPDIFDTFLDVLPELRQVRQRLDHETTADEGLRREV